MKSKTLTISILLILFAFNIPMTAQEDDPYNVIQTAVPFLSIAPDSRAGALGDAGVATSPDIFSMHWNPAKYAFIDGNGGFGMSYSPWLRALVPDINLAYLTGYYRLDSRQVLAGSLMYSSLGEIQFTNDYGEYQNKFNPNEFSVDLAYSRLFSQHWSGGVALRFIYSNITGGMMVGSTETKAGTAFAADASAYYTNDLKLGSKTGSISAGLNLSNIGSKMSYTSDVDPDFIPINMRLGTTFSVDLDKYNIISVSFDLNKLLVPTPPTYDPESGEIIEGRDPNVSVPVAIFQSFYDAPGGFSEEIKEFAQSVGVEYWYNQQFALRAGYFNESQMKGNKKYFTVGAGFRLSVFSLDFSYLMPFTQNNPLARTLRFSLGFEFDSLRNLSQK
ncbi:MAG: type IX secretion system outer membrane channel protein PorV [Bacteroidales bacterium]|nr:type IX secretion system outer membrane channel protein PorV [Bacteroidales bacterium]MDT8374575.1 type IX secretion system outer membrane channel protein PorV [Bacteroidales bacterium]